MRSEAQALDALPRGWPEGFGSGTSERRALLGLASLRGITPRNLFALAHRLGSASECLADIRAGRAGSRGDRLAATSFDAGRLESSISACGARVAVPGSAEYPDGLLDLADPPVALFLRGAELAGSSLRAAVVGARRCSPLGNEVATDLGAKIAGRGVVVVSGAARGIDRAAHEGALRAGGPTVAVLGKGIDAGHPPTSSTLLGRICLAGTIVSEYPPGIAALPFHFPARNRLIAALASAVVVVEGTRGSGSMITAEHAMEIGRTVYAVPGPVTNPLSHAPHALIREGATLLRSAQDLLEEMGVRAQASAPQRIPEPASEAGAAVLRALATAALPERIARDAGYSMRKTISVLMDLEMQGLVRAVGGRYELTLRAGVVRGRTDA
jgi:DNA processing protein